MSKVVHVVENGIPREFVLSKDFPMRPAIVDPMLDDMGVGKDSSDPKACENRAAVKAYCLRQIEEMRKGTEDPAIDYWTLGDLEGHAWAFLDGYEAAQAAQVAR